MILLEKKFKIWGIKKPFYLGRKSDVLSVVSSMLFTVFKRKLNLPSFPTPPQVSDALWDKPPGPQSQRPPAGFWPTLGFQKSVNAVLQNAIGKDGNI